MITRLEGINTNFDSIAEDAVQDTEKILIQQQQAQMMAGLYKDGSFIRPPYSAGYKTTRERIGLPVDRVTLRVSGSFYAGMFVDYRDNGNYFISSNKQVGSYNLANILIKRYGPNIWGLGGQFKSEYLRALKLALKERLNLYIRGNIS